MGVLYQNPAVPEATPDDLSRSVWELACHYAERKQGHRELIDALDVAGADVGELAAAGLLEAVRENDEPYRALVRQLPTLWWLDAELGLRATDALAKRLPEPTVAQLRIDALALVAQLDRGARPAAWVNSGDLYTLFEADESEEDSPRARVLARGVGLAVSMNRDWLSAALDMVRTGPSTGLLRALARDKVLLANNRWISALIMRGGARELALGAASLCVAPPEVRAHVRDMVAMAPFTTMFRIAEVHGLLTLGGERGMVAAEAIRTGVLAQLWQGTDLSDVTWSRAFRGELLVSRCLPEAGRSAHGLARSVAEGLPMLLADGPDAPHTDAARVSAIAECLALVLRDTPDYCAAMRLSESHLRDVQRTRGADVLGTLLRAYGRILIATCKRLAKLRARRVARSVYDRVIRLRDEFPSHMPRDAFPETMERALRLGEPSEGAEADTIGPDLRPTPEDPLPQAHEIVAAADGKLPLPTQTAAWVGADRWRLRTLLGSVIPLPLRHLLTRLLTILGCTPRARFTLSDDGRGAVTTTWRLFYIELRATRRAIKGGLLFPFPSGNLRADRMLGRWAALLIALGTVGAWLGLRANTATGQLLGAIVGLSALLGYLGALGLHRAVYDGMAVAVRTEDDAVRVWAVNPQTRFMLGRLHEADVGVAQVSQRDPDHPSPAAAAPDPR